MDNKVNKEYFRGLRHIPLVNVVGTVSGGSVAGVDNVLQELERYISIYQKQYLIDMFGSEVIPTTAGVSDLLNDNVNCVSPIADYVFCKYMPILKSQQTNQTQDGKNAGMYDADFREKYRIVWNEMVGKNIAIQELIYAAGDEETYPSKYYSELFKYEV